MSIGPDDSHSVVALPRHVGREHVFGDLVDLQDLSAIYFIDAGRTPALDAELVWIDHFHAFFAFIGGISFKNDLSFYWIVSCLDLHGSILFQITYLLVYWDRNLSVCLYDRNTLW